MTLEEWQEERTRPNDVVHSGGAAKWIQSALPLLGKETMVWFRALVDTYSQWTATENGAGQGDDIDISHPPIEWNMTYFDLVARTFIGLKPDEIDSGVLKFVLTFPDESFFDTTAVLIRTFDELFFNGKMIDADEALRLRTLLSNELRKRRHWQRVVERKSTSMEMHLARAVSSLFFHNESWGGGKCYLFPPAAEGLKNFLPLLSTISVETALSQYIALQFVDLMELKVDAENLGYFITAASAWMGSYPDDTSFWIDYGVGKRICAWLAEAMRAAPHVFSASTCPSADIDRLLDTLLRLGVADARQVEETFSQIRNDAD
jgi:hypothetical protein